MREILRHAAPGIALALAASIFWWAPILFVLLLCATMPPLVRRNRRAQAAAELDAAKALYFGQWADRIDPVWLPAEVKAWLAARPPLLGWRWPGALGRLRGPARTGGQISGPGGNPGGKRA